VHRVSAGSVTHTVLPSRSQRFLLVASSREVSVRWTHSLLKYQTLEASPAADITAVAFSLDQRCVVAGLASGAVVLYALFLPDY
jgi:hypothetical protein